MTPKVCPKFLERFVRDEEGAVTILSLFIFMMILFICGMGVDLMRYETKRSALQNTIDSATLAATNVRSDSDAKKLVENFMAARGYDPAQVSVGVDETYTGVDPTTGSPGTLVARAVTAEYTLGVDTIFMPFLGIDQLSSPATGAAQEGTTTIEISLAVDISNSMNGGGRLADLKVAATNFVNQVIDPARSDLPVTISVIPFNHTVVAPTELLNRLNVTDDVPVPSDQQAPYPGAVTLYPRTSETSQCVRFADNELTTSDLEESLDPALDPNYARLRAITPGQELDMMVHYAAYYGAGGFNDTGVPPTHSWSWRCNPDFYAAILPWATDATELVTYINALTADGNTAADTALKWSVAMLDPAMRSVVSSMVTANELPSEVGGRPYDYRPGEFMKVVVLMSDGANTRQHDLAPQFKSGPSPIWYSEIAANEYGPNGEDWRDEYVVEAGGSRITGFGNLNNGTSTRAKTWYDGYFVEYPDAPASERWLRPHQIDKTSDGVRYGQNLLPPDARQLEWTEVFARFSTGHAGLLHYDDAVGGAYDRWYELFTADTLVIDNGTDGVADRRMIGDGTDTDFGVCDAAKVNNDILVFTIAFQAGPEAEAVLRDCATSDGYYFNAQDGAALNQAFTTIATTITTLRLVQ